MLRKFILMRTMPRSVLALAQALCLCATLGLPSASHAQQGTGGRGLGLPAQQPTPTPAQPTQPGANNSTPTKTTARPELILQTGYPFGGASGLTYSPDGKLLATTTFNSNQVKLWDVATGRELRTLAIGGSGGGGGLLGGALTGVSAVAFSRDGRLLAAGGRDNAITVWDTSNGRKLHALMPGMQDGSLLGVIALVFSANARELVAFSDAVRAWDMTSGQVLRQTPLDLASLQNFASSSLTSGGGLALSADGSQLAMLSGDVRQKRTVKLYDIASGREARSVNVPDDFAECQQTTLALTPDARVLGACVDMVGNGDSTQLKLWDLSARSKARVLAEGKRANFGALTFSAGGRWLAQSALQSVKVYDTTTGAERQTFTVDKLPGQTEQQGLIAGFTFSADEKLLAASAFNGTINIRDIESGRTTQTLAGHSNFAVGVAFSADGTRLVSGARTIWDLTTGRGVRAVKNAAPFGLMSRDGRLLAAITPGDSPVTLYDTNTQSRLFTLTPAAATGPPSLKVAPANAQRGPQFAANAPAFSPDGRLLATSYYEIGNITAADDEPDEPPQYDKKAMEKAQKEMLKQMSKNPAAAMQVYNDALAQATIGGGRKSTLANQIKLWDTQTGREVRSINVPGSNAYLPTFIKEARFTPDGRAVAVIAHNSPVVTLWDVQTGAQLKTVGAASAASPAANSYSMPNLPGTAGGQMPNLGQIPGMGAMTGGPQTEAASVAFSTDGRLMAIGGKESKGGFDMGAMMAQMSGAARNPKAGRVNADDLQQQMLKQMQQTTLAGTLKLYDTATGRALTSFAGHTSEVKVIAFSPDGRLLASAAADNTIKLWDVGTGRELQTLGGHTAQINSLAFNPDSTLLASASDDGSTLLWDVRQGRQLATLASLFDGDEWLVATPDGFFDGSPKAWNQVLWRYDENTFNVAPIEWFFNEFYYPGLLADIAGGKRPRAAQNFADKDRRQPQVKVSLADAANAGGTPITTRNVRVKIEVQDAAPDAAHKTGSGALDLRLFRNGSLVKVWHGDVLAGGPSVALETTLPLVAGANRLTAYAFNRDNVKSRDANLAVTGADTLKRAGTAYVLAIGVNEYANTGYNLRYAVADAREFGAEVERQQTKLGGFARVQTVTLLDREATKANIMAALMKLAADTQPEDEVIVYFAGHGTAQANQFYLIPHDLGYTGSRTKLTAAGLQSILAHSISDRELEAAFEGVNAAQLMFVIDACNSGQALDSEEKRRGPMNSKGLAQLAYEKGMYILTAAQSFQAAQEAAQVGHGLLTYALIDEGLKQAMSDKEPKDGAVLAREWFNYAEQRVPVMQVEKMQQTRDLSFAEGEERGIDIRQRVPQKPRAYYRRELEAQPLVIARPGGQ